MYLGEGEGSYRCVCGDLGKSGVEYLGPCNSVDREEIICNRRIDHNKDYFGPIILYL